jgi:hypothetical protein
VCGPQKADVEVTSTRTGWSRSVCLKGGQHKAVDGLWKWDRQAYVGVYTAQHNGRWSREGQGAMAQHNARICKATTLTKSGLPSPYYSDRVEIDFFSPLTTSPVTTSTTTLVHHPVGMTYCNRTTITVLPARANGESWASSGARPADAQTHTRPPNISLCPPTLRSCLKLFKSPARCCNTRCSCLTESGPPERCTHSAIPLSCRAADACPQE